jgi:hypothetical protein
VKEASGELNMTLVTVLAIAAILVFVTAFVPGILNKISNNWGNDNAIPAGATRIVSEIR